MQPSEITHALNIPTFYKQTSQFWNVLRHMFTTHAGAPIYRQLTRSTHYKLGNQLYRAVEQFPTEQKMHENRELFFKSFFVIMSMTRGSGSHADWLYTSPPEFLTAMHHMYRNLLTILHIPRPLPNFGQPHPSLENWTI